MLQGGGRTARELVGFAATSECRFPLVCSLISQPVHASARKVAKRGDARAHHCLYCFKEPTAQCVSYG
jgi:hypothetical protein